MTTPAPIELADYLAVIEDCIRALAAAAGVEYEILASPDPSDPLGATIRARIR